MVPLVGSYCARLLHLEVSFTVTLKTSLTSFKLIDFMNLLSRLTLITRPGGEQQDFLGSSPALNQVIYACKGREKARGPPLGCLVLWDFSQFFFHKETFLKKKFEILFKNFF